MRIIKIVTLLTTLASSHLSASTSPEITDVWLGPMQLQAGQPFNVHINFNGEADLLNYVSLDLECVDRATNREFKTYLGTDKSVISKGVQYADLKFNAPLNYPETTCRIEKIEYSFDHEIPLKSYRGANIDGNLLSFRSSSIVDTLPITVVAASTSPQSVNAGEPITLKVSWVENSVPAASINVGFDYIREDFLAQAGTCMMSVELLKLPGVKITKNDSVVTAEAQINLPNNAVAGLYGIRHIIAAKSGGFGEFKSLHMGDPENNTATRIFLGDLYDKFALQTNLISVTATTESSAPEILELSLVGSEPVKKGDIVKLKLLVGDESFASNKFNTEAGASLTLNFYNQDNTDPFNYEGRFSHRISAEFSDAKRIDEGVYEVTAEMQIPFGVRAGKISELAELTLRLQNDSGRATSCGFNSPPGSFPGLNHDATNAERCARALERVKLDWSIAP